jgi:hypothetical protein
MAAWDLIWSCVVRWAPFSGSTGAGAGAAAGAGAGTVLQDQLVVSVQQCCQQGMCGGQRQPVGQSSCVFGVFLLLGALGTAECGTD